MLFNKVRDYKISLVLIGALFVPWGLVFTTYLLSPYLSVFQSHYAILYSIIYLCICSISCSFFVWLFKVRSQGLADSGISYNEDSSPWNQGQLLNYLTIIVLVGFASHLFDKFFIRNIPASWCIGALREAWLNYPRPSGAVTTSVWSAIGHIGVFFSFPAAFIFWTLNSHHGYWKPLIKFMLINCALFTYSLTIGSRSVVLLYLAFNLSSLVLGKILFEKKQNRLAIIATLVGSCILYASTLFYNRIACETTNQPSYIRGYFSELYITLNAANSSRISSLPSFLYLLSKSIHSVKSRLSFKHADCLEETPLCRAKISRDLMFIYLNHGIWNFETTLHRTSWPGSILLNPINAVLTRLKIISKPSPEAKRSYGAGSICLVGAIWYDLKNFGIFWGAITHGFLMSLCNLLLSRPKTRNRYLGILLFLFLFNLNALSPWCFAPNLMGSPFVAFAIGCTFLGAALEKSKFSINWLSRSPH